MVSSHVSCPVINQSHSHSTISINHQLHNNDNNCETCSNCSNDDEYQSCHNSSEIEGESICSHCSIHEQQNSHHHHHSSIHTSSSISTTSLDHHDNHHHNHHHHNHHHHNHHHHDYSSDNSSWQEEMKSASHHSSLSLSTCSSVYHYSKNEYNKKPSIKLDFIHNNAIPGDIKLITSSRNNRPRQRCRCCLCCFRSNTTSRTTTFFIFFICVLGAIAAFFCWPRTPRVSMGGGADSVNGAPPDWWAGERLPIPSQDNTAIPSRPSLRGTWQINVTLDNRDNWIPTHIRSLEFVMMDSLTLAKFAWASTSMMVLQPGTISPISLTFNVNYQASDNMDPTFQNLYNACGPLRKLNDQRSALNVLLKVYFHIFGIIWTPLVTATPYTGGILCPIK